MVPSPKLAVIATTVSLPLHSIRACAYVQKRIAIKAVAAVRGHYQYRYVNMPA